MNWNDELCGEIVTPESWAGGIWSVAPGMVMPVSRPGFAGIDQYEGGRWFIATEQFDIPSLACVAEHGHLLPIFPPRGWAGKTDAELYWQVFGGPHLPTTMFNFEYGEFSNSYDFRMGMKRLCGAADLPAAILELQNAQVLATRLRENATDTR